MISGMKTQFRKTLRRLVVPFLLCGISTGSWAFELTDLMALLARQRAGEARFTEQRFVRDLDAPVNASGTLSFEAPDKMVRRTVQPRAETMAVEGNTVTLIRSGRTRSMALDSMPEVLGMVEAMRGTLTGNSATLTRYFQSTVSGTQTSWTLELQPLDARLLAQVKSVRIAGSAGVVREIEMHFSGGDRSVTTITPMAAASAGVPPAQLAR